MTDCCGQEEIRQESSADGIGCIFFSCNKDACSRSRARSLSCNSSVAILLFSGAQLSRKPERSSPQKERHVVQMCRRRLSNTASLPDHCRALCSPGHWRNNDVDVVIQPEEYDASKDAIRSLHDLSRNLLWSDRRRGHLSTTEDHAQAKNLPSSRISCCPCHCRGIESISWMRRQQGSPKPCGSRHS